MLARVSLLGGVIAIALCGCGKGGAKGPAISEADKTARPTEAQCDAYADKSIAIGANPAHMKDYAKDLCLKSGTVALVKCIEPAKKTADLGDCLAKYPLAQ